MNKTILQTMFGAAAVAAISTGMACAQTGSAASNDPMQSEYAAVQAAQPEGAVVPQAGNPHDEVAASAAMGSTPAAPAASASHAVPEHTPWKKLTLEQRWTVVGDKINHVVEAAILVPVYTVTLPFQGLKNLDECDSLFQCQ